MVSIVSFMALLSSIPGIFATQHSTHQPGNTTDADFWYLLQSVSMQYLNVLTVIVSVWMRADLSFETWL